MTFTVTNLITDAYYDSSVVARQFETVQGYQLTDGLKWLNQILGDKATDKGDIPYITQQYPLNAVVGQETYFVPGLISIDAIVFYIGSVRYQMQYVDRVQYFGQPRANNINALPVSYTYERVYGGCNVWVYFWPQKAFVFNITGNFFMQNVALNQDLTSKITSANLGLPSVADAGTLKIGELVVNNIDLAGTYANIAALVAYINTGIVPFVRANILNFQFVLSSSTGTSIVITTLGTASTVNNVTFQDFSTTDGYFSQNFYGFALDQFYIDYLEYELGERICEKLNFDVPPGLANGLARYRLQIVNMAEPLDLTCQYINCLQQPRGLNYAQVNLGRGWTVGGI